MLSIFLSNGLNWNLFPSRKYSHIVCVFVCSLLSLISSRYVKEKKSCCCNMGYEGCLCCLISTPINILGPFGGFCWFACNSAKMRHDVASRYNLQEDSDLPSCIIGWCFPCSLFQVLMTLRHLERTGKLS